MYLNHCIDISPHSVISITFPALTRHFPIESTVKHRTLVVSTRHLYIFRGYWYRSVRRRFHIHAIQVTLYRLPLDDAEFTLRRRLLKDARWTDDANRGVVDVELLVLLKRLAERMQTMFDQLLQRTYKESVKHPHQTGRGTHTLKSPQSAAPDTSWRSGYARRSTWQSTRTSCPRAKTQTGAVPSDLVR